MMAPMLNEPLLDGVPLRKYQIDCDQKDPAHCVIAEKMNQWLHTFCGIQLSIAGSDPCGEHHRCIILGAYAGGMAIQYGDCSVYMRSGNVFVDATDIAGLGAGVSRLVSMLAEGIASSDGSELCFQTSLQHREEYARNTEAFLPVYHFVNRTPAEELTLDRKQQVLHNPNDRIFVIAHRGEHTFYPENSLESVISAWRCGADSVEVDIQKSADGVWMCMHDPCLLRTTNAEAYLGKEGFPESSTLSDWTFDQLRKLRLKDPYEKVTTFLIPTLEEMLHACNERIYIHLDKHFSLADDIFPIMEQLGVYRCVYLVNNIRWEGIEQIDHFADRNLRLDSMLRPSKVQTATELMPKVLEHGGIPAIIPLGDYIKHGETEHTLSQRYGKTIRIGAWFLRDFDYESLWREAREYGISIFMTNHPMDIIALNL